MQGFKYPQIPPQFSRGASWFSVARSGFYQCSWLREVSWDLVVGLGWDL